MSDRFRKLVFAKGKLIIEDSTFSGRPFYLSGPSSMEGMSSVSILTESAFASWADIAIFLKDNILDSYVVIGVATELYEKLKSAGGFEEERV